MGTVEALVGRTWLPLGWGTGCPRIPESAELSLRGLESHETVTLGVLEVAADGSGMITLALSRCEELRGHLGLVEVSRRSGATAGEFEIVPDKMSEDAFQTLRAALERKWTGLIFDPDGVSRLRGQLPSPADLWREIEKPIRDISSEPRSVLTRGVGLRRWRRSGGRRNSPPVSFGLRLPSPSASAARVENRATPETAIVGFH